MNERVTDQSEDANPGQDNEAVPVLITFALLFLLSAAVWFVLDRIRTDEVRSELSQRAEQGAQAPGGKAQPSKVAATK